MAEPFRMYVLTDVHFLSKKLWVEGMPITRRERGDQIALKVSPEITETFFNKIIADRETPNVLITGDLVNCGEVISHGDFKALLKKLTDAGKRVFVTTATHDYCGHGVDGDENIFSAVGYGETECYPVDYVGKVESRHLYGEYGPDSADSVDTESGSYSVSPHAGVRLIAINDNGNGRSHCGLFDEGFEWLQNEIKCAKSRGERIMLAVHHPVLPPWEIYRLAAEFEMFGGYEKLKGMMCDGGVRVIFTGHTHVQNIQKYEDGKGGFFYDISTAALGAAHGMMRKVTLDTDTGKCSVESIGIDKIKGVDTPLRACEYIYGLNFTGLLEKVFQLINTDWDRFLQDSDGFLNAEKLKKHRLAVKAAAGFAQKLKMSTLAKFGKKYNGLSKDRIKALKDKRVIDCAFVIMRHIFSGNAPYTPDTDEYRVLMGVCRKADKILNTLHRPPSSFVKGAGSLCDIARPFLYNDRTGDDNAIEFCM